MKILLPVFAISLLLSNTSCGPAAENRETMHARAKQVGDSIANVIKTSMAEAAAPGPAINVVKVDTAAAKTNSATPKK